MNVCYLYNNDSVSHTWGGQVVAPDEYYLVQEVDLVPLRSSDKVSDDIHSDKLIVSKTANSTGHISSHIEQVRWLNGFDVAKYEDDGRQMVTINRVPTGYTVYVTGESDNIASGTYGGGQKLKMDGTDANSKVCEFQLLKHCYAIGGRIIWEGCSIDNEVKAVMYAPATTGQTQNVGLGAYDKYEVVPSSGLHMYIPNGTTTGDWDLDLTSKLTNTSILKCTPVPAAGNNGFFDYDSDTNLLTLNPYQTGGYNLYDFDVNLHAYCRAMYGMKQDGAEGRIEVPELVGKLIFNSWKLKIELTATASTQKAAVMMILACKGNI